MLNLCPGVIKLLSGGGDPLGFDSRPAGLLPDEPILDTFAGPWGFSQECETGFDGRVELKTTNRDAVAHFLPSVAGD